MADLLTAKALREKRAALVTTIRAMSDKANAENRDFTAEEKPNWEKVNKDYNDYTRQIDLAERAEHVERDQRDPAGDPDIGRDDTGGKRGSKRDKGGKGGSGGSRRENRGQPTEEHRALALQAWCRRQVGKKLSERHVEACRATRTNPNKRFFDVRLRRDYSTVRREFRALSGVQGSAGGALMAPESLVNNVEMALLQFGGVRQAAETMRTDNGQAMSWPTFNDTNNKGRRIAENQAVATNKDPTTGLVTWGAHKYTSDMVQVPVEALEDAGFNLAVMLGQALGERLGRIQNDEFTTGTGNAMPNGIVTAATAGLTAASATAIAADEVIKLIHKVDPAYRVGSSFMFHDVVLLAIRLLKDGQGQYLWQPGMQSGEPDRLHTYPIVINQSMASSIAASAKTMLYGRCDKYKIRDVGTVRFRRLVERYADNDQEGFCAFMRSDGNLLDAGSHPLKYLQQAA